MLKKTLISLLAVIIMMITLVGPKTKAASNLTMSFLVAVPYNSTLMQNLNTTESAYKTDLNNGTGYFVRVTYDYTEKSVSIAEPAYYKLLKFQSGRPTLNITQNMDFLSVNSSNYIIFGEKTAQSYSKNIYSTDDIKSIILNEAEKLRDNNEITSSEYTTIKNFTEISSIKFDKSHSDLTNGKSNYKTSIPKNNTIIRYFVEIYLKTGTATSTGSSFDLDMDTLWYLQHFRTSDAISLNHYEIKTVTLPKYYNFTEKLNYLGYPEKIDATNSLAEEYQLTFYDEAGNDTFHFYKTKNDNTLYTSTAARMKYKNYYGSYPSNYKDICMSDLVVAKNAVYTRYPMFYTLTAKVTYNTLNSNGTITSTSRTETNNNTDKPIDNTKACTPAQVSIPNQGYYTFGGYSGLTNGQIPALQTKDTVTVTGAYTEKEYNVKFTVPTLKTTVTKPSDFKWKITSGTKNLDAASADYYTFKAWKDSNNKTVSSISSEKISSGSTGITLTADIEPTQYTFKYSNIEVKVSNGHGYYDLPFVYGDKTKIINYDIENEQKLSDVTIDAITGSNISKEILNKGYVFDLFTTTKGNTITSLGGDNLIQDGTISKLYAYFHPKQINATLKRDSSEQKYRLTFNESTDIFYDVAAPTGYKFEGWFTESGNELKNNEPVLETEDFIASPKITPTEWELAYSVDESFNIKNIRYDEKIELPTPEKTGYTFDGWFTTNNEEIKNGEIWKYTKNKYVIAKFTPINVKITFASELDDFKKSYDYKYDETIDCVLETTRLFIKQGYTFKYWFNKNCGSIIDGDICKLTEDTTFYAVYEPITVKLTMGYEGDNGLVVKTVDAVYGQEIKDLITPEKRGYIFKGWFVNGKEIKNGDISDLLEDTTVSAKWEVKKDDPTPGPDTPTTGPDTPTPAPSDKPVPTDKPTTDPTPSAQPSTKPDEIITPSKKDTTRVDTDEKPSDSIEGDIPASDLIAEIQESKDLTSEQKKAIINIINNYTKKDGSIYYNEIISRINDSKTLDEYSKYEITKVVNASKKNSSTTKIKNLKVKSKKKKQIKATWKKVKGYKYQIQVSNSKKFTKKTTKSYTSKKNSYTIKKKLKSKKVYYVRVRTVKTLKNGKKVYGKWSARKKVKTK